MATKVERVPFKVEDSKKGDIFKSLIDKTYLEVGHDFGIHARYTSDSGVRMAVMKIYKEVKANPEKFGVSPDYAEAISTAVENRRVAPQREVKRHEGALVDPEDIKGMVFGGRNKIAEVINRKLDMVLKDKNAIKNLNIASLGTLFGIFFDKAQILQGQATEHIAVMAKGVPSTMEPGEALNVLLNMREAQVNAEEPVKVTQGGESD